MKIMVFTEGTALMHSSAKNVSREERVEQGRLAGIQTEEKSLAYNSSSTTRAEINSVYDYDNYIPVGDAVKKLTTWKGQGVTIYYLTSRRIKKEIEAIKNVLKQYNFPDCQNLLFRKQGEDYKYIAERLMPDVLIEDDCESIGGESEMTYTHINPKIKTKIKSIVVKEFSGIDGLPETLSSLMQWLNY